MQDQLKRIRQRGEWQKLKCLELVVVRGWPNKQVAVEVGLSEQVVANFKFDFLARLRTLVSKQGLSEDVFPELYAEEKP
jgi:RNA polymerase sigma-70 factor (ECF subfamily)